MGYSGAVASEHSSGERTRRGGITKTGNAHLRRIVVEAAWAYRYRPCIGASLKTRQKTASQEVKDIAWKAQHRLHQCYIKLMAKGKIKQKVVTAVARELLGFIWAIAVEVEQKYSSSKQTRGMRNLPVFLMYPHFLPTRTGSSPSVKDQQISLNSGSMTI